MIHGLRLNAGAGDQGAADAQTLKACCARFYASDAARLLLGDSLHPGGDRQSLRLGRALDLRHRARVLDLACGSGRTAILLAREFGCSVVGVDYSAENIRAAASAARAAGMETQAAFIQADAEAPPLARGSFTAVVCECAFCTFPDKHAAARGMRRVLAPGGRLGLSDVTLGQPLPAELQSLAAWVLCIADARSAGEYVAILSAVGFHPRSRHDESWAVREIVDDVGLRLMAVEAAEKLGALPPTGWDYAAARAVLRRTKQFVDSGGVGYVLLTALAAG